MWKKQKIRAKNLNKTNDKQTNKIKNKYQTIKQMIINKQIIKIND